ncbi:litaf-like zinc finger domain-containing protein [Colletotrichum musicola]|uniref:Litaf-like zinc finger domain-containing protein n=1 Tax=Colletotrichum musicola TaxID=2175873 RepID=A0A8H6U924_9PEZI|nr:litaf-like zinc finger domain-containing protein [Colletotrichum musicola]
MGNTQILEDQSTGVRSPLPVYQTLHSPPSTVGCQQSVACGTVHCHTVQPCHHSPAIVDGSRANVVPVPMLDRWPALAECPGCHGIAATNTEHVIGKGAHWMAAMFFFTTGLGVVIPYAMKPFKNVRHSCMRCGRVLATRRFGGGTRAHLM